MKIFDIKEKSLVHKEPELKELLCNVCGKPILKNTFGYYDDHISIEKRWGYGSPYDNETHNFEICHDCYDKMIKTFKIDVSKE